MNKNMFRKILVVGFIFMFIGMSVVSSSGESIEEKPILSGKILYVGGSGPGYYTKIQDAIDDSVDGDTIFVFDDSSPYYENVRINKSINLIGEDRNTTIIDGNINESAILTSTDGITICDFTIQNSGYGIKVKSNYTKILGNFINNNNEGVSIIYSYHDNIVSGNTITGCNGPYSDGIYLWGAYQNTISKNVISYNNGGGIELIASDSNTITKNVISYNNGRGIDLDESNSNTIIENIIANNVMDGIHLYISESNSIIKNNFNSASATFKSILDNNSKNIWNRNYWNRPKFLPKLIIGWTGYYFQRDYYPLFRWFNVDWHPAQKPYDIEV